MIVPLHCARCIFFSHLCAASSSLLSPLHSHLITSSLPPTCFPTCFLPLISFPVLSLPYLFPPSLIFLSSEILLFLHSLPLLSRNTVPFHLLSFAYIRVYFLSSHLFLTSPACSRSCCLNFLATDPLNPVDVIFGAVHRADG